MRVEVEGGPPLLEGACRVVAEAGVNHNNDLDLALQLVDGAADAGAWGVKFQLYKAERLAAPDALKYWSDDTGTRSQRESFALSDQLAYEDHAVLAQRARERGIVFFATPFDLEGLEVLEGLATPIYKIASGDITHRPLIEAVASTGKPILLSTGASTIDEIEEAMSWTGYGPDKLVPLVCTLTYPTPDNDANFARLEEFRRRFPDHLIGFSDHTLGVAGGWLAGALGAGVIEKHYTLDTSMPDVPDHAMSLDPVELRALVDVVDRAARLRGVSEIGVQPSEMPARLNARRSLVAARDLPAGHTLSDEDVVAKRPGTGLPPSELDTLLGRQLRHAVAADSMLGSQDITDA